MLRQSAVKSANSRTRGRRFLGQFARALHLSRQMAGHARALAGGGFQLDPAAMQFDEAINQCEA